MAFQRTSKQIAWEDAYVKKIAFLEQLRYKEEQMIALLGLNEDPASLPDEDEEDNVGKDFVKFMGDADEFLKSNDAGKDPSKFKNVSDTDVLAFWKNKEKSFALPSKLPMAQLTADGKVIIPTGIGRQDYQKARKDITHKTKGAGFVSVDEDLFTFSNPEQNIFAPDFAAILYVVHEKVTKALKIDKLHINSGFRAKEEADPDGKKAKQGPHMSGMGVDIKASGDNRWKLADTCWAMGLRGIAIGNTFVHVDSSCDPVTGWSYSGNPIYRGPNTKR